MLGDSAHSTEPAMNSASAVKIIGRRPNESPSRP